MKTRIIDGPSEDLITLGQRRRFQNALTKLNQLVAELRAGGVPEACLYLQADSMILMSGASHEGSGHPQYDREICAGRLHFSGGGDW